MIAKLNGDGNGKIWKSITIFLAGCICTMIGFVTKDIIHQRDFITRAEAQEMVEHAPFPWNADRKYVLETLRDIKNDVEYLKRNLLK